MVVAVPGDQVSSLVNELGDALRGRVTIDTTNNLTPGATRLHSVDALVAAGATAYRALNSTGWEQMARPVFGLIRNDMPYAGPDTADRMLVHRLVETLGFRAVWLGDAASAFALTDDLTRLWFHLVLHRGSDRRLGWRCCASPRSRPACPTTRNSKPRSPATWNGARGWPWRTPRPPPGPRPPCRCRTGGGSVTPPQGSRISALAPQPDTEAPAVLPDPDEQPRFDAHIKPLFRAQDRNSMRYAFDLWSYADVTAHADAILAQLRAGSMPCDRAWPTEQVEVLARWIHDGKPA